MATISIPDPVFSKAKRIAEASGISVEDYVLGALELRIEEAPVRLASEDERLFTPERLATIDKADAETRAGQYVTREQVEARLAETKAGWIREHEA